MNIKIPLFSLLIILGLCSNSAFSMTPEKDKTIEQYQKRAAGEDAQITRNLREKLMADNQLSTNAQNIKITTAKEAITLTGPVANKEEKVKIENIARSMAGKKKVYNRLTY
jgi:osmotically-inducible protein OsmY